MRLGCNNKSCAVEVCGAEKEGRLRGPGAQLAPIFSPEPRQRGPTISRPNRPDWEWGRCWQNGWGYVYTSQPENINVEQQPDEQTSWPNAFYLTHFFLIIYTDKHNTNYKNTHGCNISTYLVNVGYLKKIVLFCHISNMGQFLETLKAVQTDRNKELFVFVVTSKHKFSSKRNISIILKPLNYVMQPIGPSAQNPYSK